MLGNQFRGPCTAPDSVERRTILLDAMNTDPTYTAKAVWGDEIKVFKPEDFDWLLPDLGSSSKRVEIADFCNKRLKEK
jgi:hypothetical protein